MKYVKNVRLAHPPLRPCTTCLGGPRGEPVDGAAVHQRWELPQARAQRGADGAHPQHDVEVQPAALHEEVEEGVAVQVAARLPGDALHRLRQALHVLRRVQVWDLACGAG